MNKNPQAMTTNRTEPGALRLPAAHRPSSLRAGRAARRGISALEAAIMVAIFGTLMSGFMSSLSRFQSAQNDTGVRNDLLRAKGRAVRVLRQDLRRSGFVSVGGVAYPVTVPDGGLAGGFPFTAHPPSVAGATPNSELLMVMPIDGDNDGWPDFAGGQPVFGPDRIAYYLVPDGQGANVLTREVENGRVASVCRDVVRFTVETPAETGFTIPLDSLRVRLTLSKQVPGGLRHTVELDEVVRLVNGGLAP